MRKVVFETAELQLIAIYQSETRLETIEKMRKSFKILEKEKDKDIEMINLMVSAIYKLGHVSENIYQELNVGSYLQNQEDDSYEV